MLIQLPENTSDEIKDIKNVYDKKITGINALFDSMRRGQHIVYADDSVLKCISNHELISPTNKEYVKWIRQKAVYVYQCCDVIKYKVEVTFNTECIERNENTFFVPIEMLEEIKEAQLLAENESDGELFVGIYRQIYIQEIFQEKYNVKFENAAFHGGNVQSKIKSSNNQNRIMLCFVDSDRNFPEDSRKSTATAADKIYKKLKDKSIIELRELSVREKENLISPQMYMALSPKDNVLLEVLSRANIDVIKYFDFKDGFKYKVIKRFKGNTNWEKCWGEFIEKCEEKKIYSEPVSDENEEYKCIEGIGSSLCDQANTVLLVKDETKYEENYRKSSLSKNQKGKIDEVRKNILDFLPKELLEEWKGIAEIIFSFGCCLIEQFGPLGEI